ncbi:MAG: hypothetical protein K9I29_04740 [Bacteroidales bacterium]|nr:hypothetical protein [Bacteroidales bacterium]
MEKKAYQKPEIEIVDLRVEERMADCTVIYYSSHTFSGCNDTRFENIDPDSCVYYQNDSSS